MLVVLIFASISRVSLFIGHSHSLSLCLCHPFGADALTRLRRWISSWPWDAKLKAWVLRCCLSSSPSSILFFSLFHFLPLSSLCFSSPTILSSCSVCGSAVLRARESERERERARESERERERARESERERERARESERERERARERERERERARESERERVRQRARERALLNDCMYVQNRFINRRLSVDSCV
jgi:hypothetical protein